MTTFAASGPQIVLPPNTLPVYFNGGAAFPSGNYRIRYVTGYYGYTNGGYQAAAAQNIFYLNSNDHHTDGVWTAPYDTDFSTAADAEAFASGTFVDIVSPGGPIGMSTFNFYEPISPGVFVDGQPNCTFELLPEAGASPSVPVLSCGASQTYTLGTGSPHTVTIPCILVAGKVAAFTTSSATGALTLTLKNSAGDVVTTSMTGSLVYMSTNGGSYTLEVSEA